MHKHVARLVLTVVLPLALLGLPAAANPHRDPAAHASTDASELRVHLAPAIVHVDQQVVVHARFQLNDHPGSRPEAGARPEGGAHGAAAPGVAPERTGRPDDAGRPDPAVDPGARGDDDDAPFEHDDAPFEHDDEGDDTSDNSDDTPDDRDDEVVCPVVDDGDDTGDDTDDEGDDTSDDSDDDSGDADDGVCAGVTFTVDYGDGTPVELMRITKGGGNDGSRKAIARHRYAAEGAYEVTVTATPFDGEPVSVTVTAQVGGGRARLHGEDRIATAVRVSQDTFPEDGTAQAVLLARADQFADALASAPLALLESAPVLLTTGDAVPVAVVEELARALAEGGKVTILGGESAISPDIDAALLALGYEVVRISGSDRIGTALAVAEAVVGSSEVQEVVVAAAGGFADALAAAAHAAAHDAIVLLTDGTALDPRVESFLATLGTEVPVTVVGGDAAVAPGVVEALEAAGFSVTRVEGDDRFETAVALAEAAFDAPDTVFLATGRDFPDALAGAASAARHGAPVLLVGDDVPDAVRAYLVAHADVIERIFVLGGDAAVPEDVVQEAEQLIGG